MSEYTYYGFQDDLCDPEEHDSYRLGPEGLQYQVELFNGEKYWVASAFESMEQLLTDSLEFGDARYWEINVD